MGEIGTTIEGFFTDLEGLLMLISGSLAVIGVIGLAILYLGSSWPLISDWKRDNPKAASQVTIGLLLLIFVGGGGMAALGIGT
jgi:phage-related minor tail protein